MTSYKQDPASWFQRNRAFKEPYASEAESLSLLDEDKDSQALSDDGTQNEET